MHKLTKGLFRLGALTIMLSGAFSIYAEQSLIERLISTEGVTRTVARKELKALPESEKKQLVPGLRKIVRGDNTSRALDAVIALGKIGPSARESVPDMAALLGSRPREPEVIFNALVQIGTASVQGLVPFLECREPADIYPTLANEALGRIGGVDAKAAMKEDADCGSAD